MVPGFGHVDEVSAGPVGELHGIDAASGAHDVAHVGDGCPRGRSDIQHLGARAHVDAVHAACQQEKSNKA